MRERIPSYEEQKVLGNRDATSEYVTEAREEFWICMQKIFLEIAKKAFNKEENVADAVMEKAINCWRSYFQSMKGGINLTNEDIKNMLRKEEDRQKKFYNALTKIVDEFRMKGFRAEILPPDECYANSYWDTGLTVGCNIKINNAYLCAFPLVPATTSYFLSLRQESAANIILLSKDFIIMQPYDQTLEEEFWKVNEKMFTEKDVKDDFPEADFAVLKNNFLLLVSSKIFSKAELEKIRKNIMLFP